MAYARVTRPTYADDFACVGSACTDTCCTGYQFTIDQQTYEQYQNLNDPVLRPTLDTTVHAIANNPYPSRIIHAMIEPTQSGSCPFLCADRLCAIQRRLGEAWLSNTCAIYPRAYNLVLGDVEKSGSLSCPEMARLALLQPDGIQFHTQKEAVDDRIYFRASIQANGATQYIHEIRRVVLFVLQDRNHSLAQRLWILAAFCTQLDHAVQSGETDTIPDLSETFLTRTARTDWQLPTPVPAAERAVQLDLLRHLLTTFADGGTGDNLERCVAASQSGLTGATPEEAYAEALRNRWRKFQQQHGYILENYLVNYVFSHLFPFGIGNATIATQFRRLLIHYSLVQSLLATSLRQEADALVPARAVACIQTYVREVENSAHVAEFEEIMQQKAGGDSVAALLAPW